MNGLPQIANTEGIKCRFGCDNGLPVALYHVPAGCICWTDPVQALCYQHFISAESTGPIVCIAELRPALARGGG